jgi:hypothetical protein
MADNTDEEQLENPANTQSENLSEEVTPTKDTGAIIPNQDAENMEVHHHAHHEGKKSWKSYFWEFLMLFLAVFCGFLAEYQLEHTLEHQRAKEFAKSLIQDLKNDTIAINTQMERAEIYVGIADSLRLKSKKQLDGSNAAEFSFYTRFMYWTTPLLWNRATFEQVKNSGGLRYFRNFQLLGKLMKYEAQINEIEGEFSNHQTRGNMLLKLINEIIDPQLHYDLSKYQLLALDTMSRETKENYFITKTASLETKRELIRELLNMTIAQQRNLRFNNVRLQEAKELAKELIGDLKREYHIE